MAETRYFGKRIKRNEDPRLLTGQALFVDDVNLPNMGHVAFVRSPHAHARILSIDATAVEEMEGVIAVYTAESMGDDWVHGPLLVSPPPIDNIIFNERTQVPLAKDKVRYAGEPVVAVVAESRYIAEDAVDVIWVDYEPLLVVVDLEAAILEDAPQVHDDLAPMSTPMSCKSRATERASTPSPGRRPMWSNAAFTTITARRRRWKTGASWLIGIIARRG